jgi:hypothetical protein
MTNEQTLILLRGLITELENEIALVEKEIEPVKARDFFDVERDFYPQTHRLRMLANEWRVRADKLTGDKHYGN